MLLKPLIEKPMLAIGILMFIVFLYSLKDKDSSLFMREEYLATSCKAVRVKLDKRIPATWESSCEGNNLAVAIVLTKESNVIDREKYMYRELANNLAHIAKSSPYETLERVDFVRVIQVYRGREINALTEGKHIVKLATMSNSEHIKDHLKTTVKVQEKKFE